MTFALTVLGSNSAYPTSNRYPTAHVLQVHERFFLIDCGEGTQMQIRRFHIPLARIHHIFVSHLHGDHWLGLYGLLSTLGLLGRKSDLHIYGPPELETLIRFQHKITGETLGFPVFFHPLNFEKPTEIFRDRRLTIRSIPLNHRSPTCGFVFREIPRERKIRKEMIDYLGLGIRDIVRIKQGEDYISPEGNLFPNAQLTLDPAPSRSYAFCSDTAYHEAILPEIKGVDLLYHEATFSAEMADRAKETGHSTTHDAARIAQKAFVKKLIIGHFSARFRDAGLMVEEARTIFTNTEAAEDGRVFSLE